MPAILKRNARVRGYPGSIGTLAAGRAAITSVQNTLNEVILQRFGRRIRGRALSRNDRSRSTLFPERLDDYLGEDNLVRAIDVFVDALDLAGLGFGGIEPEVTGRPAYHPATLLKIYVYGYLNRVQSSRRLERECQRTCPSSCRVWSTSCRPFGAELCALTHGSLAGVVAGRFVG
jgi:hypothetical protein